MYKILLMMCIIVTSIFGVQRVWNSSGSTDANNGNNYNPTGTILSTDTLVLNNTSLINWVQTDSLNVASINMATTFKGSWSMNSHPLVTSYSLYLNGTVGTWIMNSNYYMIGDGKFHIGTFGNFSGYGCDLNLLGSHDTLEFSKWGLTKSHYFKTLSCCVNSTDTCWIVSNIGACIYHQWTIGLGEVVRTSSGYFGVDPDTAYPFNFAHSSHNATCPAFNGGVALYWNDSTINNLYWGFMSVGGSMGPAVVVNTNNDTLIFNDSITAPGGIRWVLGAGHSITVKNTTKYFNCFGGACVFGGDTSSSLIWYLGSANVYGLSQVNAYGTPKVTFYMDTSIFQITSNYNTSSSYFKSFTTYPMQSRTVIWNAITITTSGESYNVVACTTATNKSFLTQFKCKDFIVKEGTTSFAIKPAITGNYIDSTGLNPSPETLSVISHSLYSVVNGGSLDTFIVKGAGAAPGLYGKVKIGDSTATIVSWLRTSSTGNTVRIVVSTPAYPLGSIKNDTIWGQYSSTSYITVDSGTVYTATRTWCSSGSTDANNGLNYNPTGTLLSTDTLILNGSSIINWILSSNLNCANISSTPVFTGLISTNGHMLTTAGGQKFNHNGVLIFNDTTRITGKGLFYIGSNVTAICTGATLDLRGDRHNPDTIDIEKAFASPSVSFKNFYAAYDTGSSYIITNLVGEILCYHFWKVGSGSSVSPNNLQYGIDPDTSHFQFFNGPKNRAVFDDPSFRGYLIQNTNPLVTKLYQSFVDITNMMNFRTYQSDTLVFTDTQNIGSIRFNQRTVGIKTVVQLFPGYHNFIAGMLLNGFANTVVETHGGTSTWVCGNFGISALGGSGSQVVYLDSSKLRMTGSWNTNGMTFNWFPGISTITFTDANDTVLSSNKPFYNVVCSTAVFFLDSATILNNFKIKMGKFHTNSSIKVLGTFIDSTSAVADTATLSSLFLYGDAHFSSQSHIKWNSGAIIHAMKPGNQTFYTNGITLTKVVVAKGTKLVIK